MDIALFDKSNRQLIQAAAALLIECFPHSYKDSACDEVKNCLSDDRIAVMATDGGHLVGFIGAIPQYGTTGWELHPLAVKKEYRLRKVGTRLVSALEKECRQKGCITLYLGTDDEFGQTSLSNTDLYLDLYQKVANIKNLKSHPYEFYQKAGYQIVGVLPDANGLGKPDIWMAKCIANFEE